MRRFVIHFIKMLGAAVWSLGLSASAAPQAPDAFLARFQFVGASSLKGDTNAGKWREIWSLPATEALWRQTLDRTSRAVRESASNRLSASVPDGSKLILPLLDDLFTAESFVEVGGAFELPEFLIVLKLNEERATLWDKNLSRLISTWKAGSPKNTRAGNYTGWELKKSAYPNAIRFLRAGNWILFAMGNQEIERQNAILEQLQKNGRPFPAVPAWIRFEATKSFLSQLHWSLPPLDFTSVQFNLIGRGENLRIDGQLRYADTIVWTNEAWNIPYHLIRDPLISFTAARGVAPVLAKNAHLKKIGPDPMPNQFFLWAQSEIPFLSFAAFPAKKSQEIMRQLGERLPQLYNPQLITAHLGEIKWSSNRTVLAWAGLPFVMPTLEADTNPASQFIYAKLFPPLPSTNLPPPELFREVQTRPGLAYYDWEITEQRLTQWRHMKQLSQVVSMSSILLTNIPARREMLHMHNSHNSLAQKWLIAIGPKLGNTVTQLLMKNPHELSMVRSGHAGLTSFELVTLADWLERPAFPLFGYKVASDRKSGDGLSAPRKR